MIKIYNEKNNEKGTFYKTDDSVSYNYKVKDGSVDFILSNDPILKGKWIISAYLRLHNGKDLVVSKRVDEEDIEQYISSEKL